MHYASELKTVKACTGTYVLLMTATTIPSADSVYCTIFCAKKKVRHFITVFLL